MQDWHQERGPDCRTQWFYQRRVGTLAPDAILGNGICPFYRGYLLPTIALTT